MILGVDVGGTFTDAVLLTGDRLVTGKAPTTPGDQSEGVMAAVDEALAAADASARACRPSSSRSVKPSVASSAVRATRPSSSAFVPTVMPCTKRSTSEA